MAKNVTMSFESAQFNLAETDTTRVIAEVGVNHNGDPRIARQLIEAIADAGADIVKLQLFHSSEEISKYAPRAPYQEATDIAAGGQMELCKALELEASQVDELRRYCANRRMPFLCTAFDFISLKELVEMGVKTVKIPSPEITNIPFLRTIGSYGLDAILSTGASSLAEVEVGLNALVGSGAHRVALLHCISSYPAPAVEMNLRAIPLMRQTFGVPVGLSDHSIGIGVPIAAAALGACLIEKHVTLDRTMPGPDHFASIEPHHLKMMVEGIREANQSLGSAVKEPSQSESVNRPLIRKSLVARGDLGQGSILCPEMIAIKRPEGGITPADLDKIVGRKLKRSIPDDQFISWDDLE